MDQLTFTNLTTPEDMIGGAELGEPSSFAFGEASMVWGSKFVDRVIETLAGPIQL